MRNVTFGSLILLIVLLGAACGSGDDSDQLPDQETGSPTLQLSTGPISENEFRVQVRQLALVQSQSFDSVCGFFSPTANSFSAPELLELFQRLNVFTSRTPIAQAVLDDEIRAVEILAEECESLT